jgi:hypothetical protein
MIWPAFISKFRQSDNISTQTTLSHSSGCTTGPCQDRVPGVFPDRILGKTVQLPKKVHSMDV